MNLQHLPKRLPHIFTIFSHLSPVQAISPLEAPAPSCSSTEPSYAGRLFFLHYTFVPLDAYINLFDCNSFKYTAPSNSKTTIFKKKKRILDARRKLEHCRQQTSHGWTSRHNKAMIKKKKKVLSLKFTTELGKKSFSVVMFRFNRSVARRWAMIRGQVGFCKLVKNYFRAPSPTD